MRGLDDMDASDIIASGGALRTDLAQPRVKRAALNLSSPNATGAVTDWLRRDTIQLPQTTRRWRLRIRNWVPYTAALGTANVTTTAVYIGEPVITTAPAVDTGKPTGAFVNAPVQALAGVALGAAGAEYLSPWVTSSSLQFQANKLHMISMGFTAPSGTVANGGQSVGFTVLNSGGAANVAAQGVPAGQALSNTAYLDIVMEYEFANSASGVRTGIIVGDSNSLGFGNTGIPVWAHQVFHQRMGQLTGMPIASIGVSGYTLGNFTNPATGLYTRFDLGGGFVPDDVFLQAGTNDFGGNQAATAVQAKQMTIIANMKAIGAKRVWMFSIPPRLNNGVPGYFSRSPLTAAANIGDTTITTQDKIVGDLSAQNLLNIDPGVAGAEARTASTLSTGVAGAWVTTVPALTNAHAIGAIVETVGETQRRLQNPWANSGLGDIAGAFDVDRLLRDPNNIYRMNPEYQSDQLHWSSAAHSAVAGLIRIS